MQQSRSIKKTALATASLIFLLGAVYAEPIGDVRELKGNASLTRDGNVLVPQLQTNIELNDTAETTNGRMLIEFLDKAELSLTEHTRVYIDKVYYDPNPSKSKMTMRMALGTARFASGRLGMVNKNNIDISTPTASIQVRGTDFTTTIDELGRSLVVLLPDEFGNPSGIIDVFNEGGRVTLTEAYAATVVSTIDSPPTVPVTIQNITASMIDNMFIVSPPPEVKRDMVEEYQDDMDADQGILDVDFLEFNELETDFLAINDDLEFTELDIDFLDVDFLTDALDVIEELVRTSGNLDTTQLDNSTGELRLTNATVGFNKDSQYNIFQQDNDVIFYRDVNGTIRLAFSIDASVRLETDVEGYEGTILLNEGGDSIIVIKQGG